PLRHQYLHRIVAAAMVGRALTRDEEVNHKDQDRRNFWFTNLFILGNTDHGWVSSKQAYFMRHRDAAEKQEWDTFMADQEQQQAIEIARAKNDGVTWPGLPDGALQTAWERRNEETKTQADGFYSDGTQ